MRSVELKLNRNVQELDQKLHGCNNPSEAVFIKLEGVSVIPNIKVATILNENETQKFVNPKKDEQTIMELKERINTLSKYIQKND